MTEASLRPATLQDVGRLAGVSASTVSRYLNGKAHLAGDTQTQVRKAIEELHYVKNVRAGDLARGRSRVIGFVVPDISNPYFGAIADHVVEAVERHGLLVVLCSTRNQLLKQSSYIDLLSSGAIDGMLYLGSFRFNERLAGAIRGGLPVVVLDEPIADLPDVHTVVVDDYSGGYQAAGYLVQLGHREIAFVSGPEELNSVQERYRGYSDALKKADIDPDSQINIAGSFTEQFGMSALAHLLGSAKPPTAAFAASDYIALGIMSSAEANGTRIPEDLSIVGFDDVRFSQYVRPRLTTVRSPLDRMAELGVELLFEQLGDAQIQARTEVLPVELVLRDSCAPPQPRSNRSKD